MNDERHDVIVQSEGTPRWVGGAVVVLAIVSIAGLGMGWSATNHEKALEQNLGTLGTQSQQYKQGSDLLAQRLSKAEDTNAQLQGELSVVTDKMKLTEGELGRARAQAGKIRKDDEQQLADLQTNLNTQLQQKANTQDVSKLGTDVDGVKTDLETTKNNLTMARGEFGTMVAKNHDEIEELRRLGERDYYEFSIDRKKDREKVGDMMVELQGVNTKKNLYSVALYVDDSRYDKKNRSVNEPIYFFSHGSRAPMEFVVNSVSKDKIAGYLSVPKTASTHAQNSGN